MPKMVYTVTGPVNPGDLGWCQTHEHVLCDYRLAPRKLDPVRKGEDFMYLGDTEKQVRELTNYYNAGGRALVEVTSSGWGRDVLGLRELSQSTGVKIMAMSGFYMEPTIPLYVDDTPVEKLAEMLVEELTVGVEGTGIRTGILKSAILRSRIEAIEEKALRAVALASKANGAAITTHTTGSRRHEVRTGSHGPQHLRIVLEEGVPAHRLIVGHVDERPDIQVLSELAQKGCYIQFDVLGKEHYIKDETRAYLISRLIKDGHLKKVLIGTDRCRESETYRELGGKGYTYVHDVFVSYLKTKGISDSEVSVIMCENPGEALAF